MSDEAALGDDLDCRLSFTKTRSGSSIVYMKYFYFLLYAMLVAVASNAYMFSMGAAPSLKFIHYQDSLIPKLLYWLAVLLSYIATKPLDRVKIFSWDSHPLDNAASSWRILHPFIKALNRSSLSCKA